MGDMEVLRPAQCWLRPCLAGGKRVVCEILGQAHWVDSGDGDRLLLLAWEREGDRELRVGNVVTAHEGSLSGFHRGAGSELRLPHSELEGTSQTLVLLACGRYYLQNSD